ncbi:4-hydroxybenzoate octaprenyltransferase [Agarilytica rhodophyticola]|uniref:4-hydroxybenzoate octaprenyltransferase n=1 Tax=Agarilytica rhodophyticola TaxID=1737490 RepID=UPI000B347CED|nr:4-hydroxybenzoate octaprenyltransferase [Agarilytica rhodophyticola]
MNKEKLIQYGQLMRLDRPIGIYLVAWPTLWALWLAAKGFPDWDVLIIFLLGVVVMRSAGCVINDFADRKIDKHVERTKNRPLTSGIVSSKEALGLFAVLCIVAFALVLLTNTLTVMLSLGALALASAYPFMKRYTHLPQVVLGAAFAWAVPMSFTAQTGELQPSIWLIYTTVVLWTVIYDTFYAMVDRKDDIKLGVKSTAILLGDSDLIVTKALQVITLIALYMMGSRFELGIVYKLSLLAVAALFVYQQYLIRERKPQLCFKAFLNNNWVGMAVFVGIAGDYATKTL